MKKFVFVVIVVSFVIVVAPLAAHHSFAMFDYNKDVTVTGEVKQLHADFNGVWRPIVPPAAPRTNTTLRWRPGDTERPPFNAEYRKKFDAIQASRESGSEDTEPVASRCLPPGMPWFMRAQYGIEIVQSPRKVAFVSEWMDTYRRVYMDGRRLRYRRAGKGNDELHENTCTEGLRIRK